MGFISVGERLAPNLGKKSEKAIRNRRRPAAGVSPYP